MEIVDTLKPDHMPEMVYALCKMAKNGKYTVDEIKSKITLDDNDSNKQFNAPFKFALDCEFIFESDDKKIKTVFTDEDLSSYRRFRFRIFKEVYKKNTNFTHASRWYLSQNESIYKITKGDDLYVAFSDSLTNKANEKSFALAFRFWIIFMGLATKTKNSQSFGLLFATNNIIQDWIEFDKPFEKGQVVSCREFFDKLVYDLPVFNVCVNNNSINLSLTIGLRALDYNDYISLIYSPDSGDIWKLHQSKYGKVDITNIKVGGI